VGGKGTLGRDIFGKTAHPDRDDRSKAIADYAVKHKHYAHGTPVGLLSRKNNHSAIRGRIVKNEAFRWVEA